MQRASGENPACRGRLDCRVLRQSQAEAQQGPSKLSPKPQEHICTGRYRRPRKLPVERHGRASGPRAVLPVAPRDTQGFWPHLPSPRLSYRISANYQLSQAPHAAGLRLRPV
eukprot:scaffold99041_cov31-Prasinocladus_malaysianus.AAC.1